MKEKRPVSVGIGDDIYTIPHLSDDLKYMMETIFFKKIDQEGNDVLHKMLRGGRLSPDEKISWAVSVIALKQRHPVRLKELAKDVSERYGSEIKQKETDYYAARQEGDTTSYEKYLEDNKSEEWIDRQKIAALREIIIIPRTIAWIASADWSILTPIDSRHTFLTSDRPVIMTNGLAH